jgi:hypothetical protein
MTKTSKVGADRAGWVNLMGTAVLHYVVGAKSLCNKWMYFGSSFMPIGSCEHLAKTCKGCTDRLAALQKAATVPADVPPQEVP